jgi:cytochrome P450
MGPRDVYQIVHPEHIRDVLVTHQHRFAKSRALQWARLFLGNGLLTSEPPTHTRHRRLAQPAFHRQRVASYAAVMVDHAERTSQRWRDGARVDMAREMMVLTMGVAGRTLFDAEVEGEEAEIGRSLDVIVQHFPRYLLPFPHLIERLPLPSNRRFARARAPGRHDLPHDRGAPAERRGPRRPALDAPPRARRGRRRPGDGRPPDPR